MNKKPTLINLDQESKDWLAQQPRSFNLSEHVRKMIHALMEQEKENKPHDTSISTSK